MKRNFKKKKATGVAGRKLGLQRLTLRNRICLTKEREPNVLLETMKTTKVIGKIVDKN